MKQRLSYLDLCEKKKLTVSENLLGHPVQWIINSTDSFFYLKLSQIFSIFFSVFMWMFLFRSLCRPLLITDGSFQIFCDNKFSQISLFRPGGSTTATPASTPALAAGLFCCQDMFFFSIYRRKIILTKKLEILSHDALVPQILTLLRASIRHISIRHETLLYYTLCNIHYVIVTL